MGHRFRWAAVLAGGSVGRRRGYCLVQTPGRFTWARRVCPRVGPPRQEAVVPFYVYRPWGFGFFPFGFRAALVSAVPSCLLGRFFRRRRWYYRGPHDVPPSFDEWHQRGA